MTDWKDWKKNDIIFGIIIPIGYECEIPLLVLFVTGNISLVVDQ